MATRTQATVVAVFRNRSDAEAAASDLKANGFGPDDIFISSDKSAVDAAQQPGGVYSDTEAHRHRGHEHGIVGWFKSIFGQDDEQSDRTYYENAIDTGHTFLSVDVTDESMDRAADILNNHNPVDVHRETGSEQGRPIDTQSRTADPLAKAPPTGAVPAYGAGTVPPRGPAPASAEARTAAERGLDTAAERGTGPESGAIPVVREELKIGKRAVLKGGVRVYSRVVDEPVEETVRLRQESVRVERAPANREATPADLNPGREQVFEVKEFTEEPVVSKQARVVEEVRIHKDATERTETVRDNVRRTEVNVENVGPGSATRATGTTEGTALGDNEEDFRRHYQSTYGTSGQDYETYRPGYEYGYQMANDPRYRGRNFDEVESDLRSDYARRYPNSTWEKVKDSIRYGWDKLTRKV
jgi:uncharacterized protein (TIGR02271 family)